jgi:hypothetical protein
LAHQDAYFVTTTRLGEDFGWQVAINIINEGNDIILKKKAYNAILLPLSNGILREVTNEKITTGIWKKLDSLYMKKSLPNWLYLNQRLYTLKMKEMYASL